MLEAIAFIAALALACFVVAPLLSTGKDPGPLSEDVTPLADLKRRRMVVYENLKDLEFEFAAHKIAPKDFETLRQTYNVEAAGLLTAERDAARGSSEEAFIEREVQLRRARRELGFVPNYTCKACGFENPLPVKFCGECGAKIEPATRKPGPRPKRS